MTQEQINFICNKAHEITKEIWGSEHMICFGNLEVKMQEIVKKLTIPAVDLPLDVPSDEESDKEANYYGRISKENFFPDFTIDANATIDFARGAAWMKREIIKRNK